MDDTWWRKPEDLDADQQNIIDLPPVGNHLILGPPGSGKTNLLVLRGSYLHLAGSHNLAIITFNRTLKEFLCTGTDYYEFSTDKITTYVKWSVDILVEKGISIPKGFDFTKLRAFVTEKLLELVKSGKQVNKLDCILLDEAQDYSQGEAEIFLKFSKQIFAVGDPNQQIYSEGNGMDVLRGACPSVNTLKYHYRNGLKICRMADSLRDQLDAPEGMESASQYNEKKFPSSIEVVHCDDIKAQAERIIRRLETQLRAYPGERLGIACPRHEELAKIWALIENSPLGELAQLQTFQEGYMPMASEKPICVTTVHGTKGMEFRALHIAGAEFLGRFKALQRNLAYTGVTRAKTSLTLYHTQGLPGYVENAFAATQKPPPKPTVKDLFKKASEKKGS